MIFFFTPRVREAGRAEIELAGNHHGSSDQMLDYGEWHITSLGDRYSLSGIEQFEMK